MIARKIQRISTSAKPLTSYPVRSASSSLIVGRSVNVKIVASTADQMISRKNAGASRSRVEHRERRSDRAFQGADDELHAQLEQPPRPADQHDEKLHEAGPIEPHHAQRVPPRQRDRLQERNRASQTEGDRVERYHGAPDRGDEDRCRQQQQHRHAGEAPEGLALKYEPKNPTLEWNDPRQSRHHPSKQLRQDEAPLLGLRGASDNFLHRKSPPTR